MPQQVIDTSVGTPAGEIVPDSLNLTRFSDTEVNSSDSIKAVIAKTDNIFENHSLERSSYTAQVRQNKNPDWAVFSLLAIITYFTVLWVLNNKVFRQLFSAFVSFNVTSQLVRDENILIQRTAVLLSVLFYLAGGFFLYQASIYYNWESDIIGKGFVRFFFFAFALALAYSLKMIVLKIFDEIFLAGRPVSFYIFNVFLVNNIAGIFLLPVIILIAFLPIAIVKYIFTGTLIIFCLLWIYRISRGAFSWITQPGNSLYYLILYICALEIAPMLIVLKLI